MTNNTIDKNMTFTISIEGQKMIVSYNPYCYAPDYAHFEFTSPYEPARRIPVSETGYRSQFLPMQEMLAAPSVEEYAYQLALAIINEASDQPQDEEADDQMLLF